MDAYKKLWKKLKNNITDPEVLALMKTYEKEEKPSYLKCKYKKYSIILASRPWYHLYQTIQHRFLYRIRQGTLKKEIYINFKRELSKQLEQLSSKKITDTDIENWLKLKQKEYKLMFSEKPTFTVSGFEKKSRAIASLDERTNIVIDKLVYNFTPKVPNSYKLNIKLYEEDWRQELWKWCYEQKETNPNLKLLILNYNNMSVKAYKYITSCLYSLMNRYIIAYIMNLQYSCTNISKYISDYNSDKYIEEINYPSNNLQGIHYMNIDASEVTTCEIKEDLLENHDIIKNIIKDLYEEHKEMSNFQLERWERHMKVLEMRYGFNKENRVYSFEEIGACLGVTKQRVQQMEVHILKKIKNYYNKIKEK